MLRAILLMYKWRRKNKEKWRKYCKAWKRKNIEKVRAYYRKANLKRTKQMRKEVIMAYGSKCACCKEKEPEFLTVDHIGGWGKKHRAKYANGNVYPELKRKGFPKRGIQLLCMNCNWATRYGKSCPHQNG